MPSLSSRIEGTQSYWVTSTPMRVHPATPPLGVVTTPLSILDNSVARFSPTGAVFLFDTIDANESSPYSSQCSPRWMAGLLEEALGMVLGEYPHFAGQLSWSPMENGKGGCVEVTYGKGEGGDPGVSFEVVRLQERIFRDFLDGEEIGRENVKGRRDFLERNMKEKKGITSEESEYDKLRDGLEPGNRIRVVEESMVELEPKGKLALWDLEQVGENGVALPGVRIQLTILGRSASNGYAVGIKMAHVLGDAQTLVGFMKRWAQLCPSYTEVEKRKEQVGKPVFDPRALDRVAEGTENVETFVDKVCELLGNPTNLKNKRTGDERIVDAIKLPCHRFDWWRHEVEGYPDFLKSTTEKSRKLAPIPVDKKTSSTDVRTDLTTPPWHTWDLTKSCDHIEIYFSAKQLQDLKASCSTGQGDEQISRLDALLTYIWTRINRARFPGSSLGKTPKDETVYLNLTLGARTRVSPPLPETFIGSPIFLANVSQPLSFFTNTTSSEVSPTVAKRIRSTINQFTPQALSDLLFSSSQEAVPNRVWQAFLGQRHTLVTSWLHLGAGDVDFFGDNDGLPVRGRADVVRPIMPKMDGCVWIMEDIRKFRENEEGHKGGWMVNVYLEREAGKRLLGMLEQERAGDEGSTLR